MHLTNRAKSKLSGIGGIIFIYLTLTGGAVYAEIEPILKEPNPIRFIHEAAQVGQHCPQFLSCKGTPYRLETIYRYSQGQKLEADMWSIFKRIAKEQAQVWGDTILEGDYVSSGETRIDRIFEIYKHNFLIGYIVTYSEKAWDVSDCRYDGVRPSTLTDCAAGRIEESSFVSLDFKQFFYTDHTYAKFK